MNQLKSNNIPKAFRISWQIPQNLEELVGNFSRRERASVSRCDGWGGRLLMSNAVHQPKEKSWMQRYGEAGLLSYHLLAAGTQISATLVTPSLVDLGFKEGEFSIHNDLYIRDVLARGRECGFVECQQAIVPALMLCGLSVPMAHEIVIVTDPAVNLNRGASLRTDMTDNKFFSLIYSWRSEQHCPMVLSAVSAEPDIRIREIAEDKAGPMFMGTRQGKEPGENGAMDRLRFVFQVPDPTPVTPCAGEFPAVTALTIDEFKQLAEDIRTQQLPQVRINDVLHLPIAREKVAV